MCGIAGVINKCKGRNLMGEKTLLGLRKAMMVQKHRGPDDEGVCAFRFIDGSIEEADDALRLMGKGNFDGMIGFNRLSIKDLSMSGHQPMVSKNKKVILVFNGEIYNDTELRKKLEDKGYIFRSTTDSEVVLNMYLEYGFASMLPKLNGMFAIVIADLQRNLLFMARDRFGIKPLYYSFCSERLYFASELKAMIQFEDFQRKLDIEAFNARLIFSRPSSKVLLKDVEILKPGQAMSLSIQGDIRFWKFFDVDDYMKVENQHQSLDEVLQQADAVISEAVGRQMLSDVKVGCQVSGGIDSTIVSYYANKIDGMKLRDGVSIIEDVGMSGGGQEEYYIDHVGKVLDINLHKFKLDEAFFLNHYQKLVWYNDAPLYKPFFTSFYKLTQGAKDYVTVLMSGEGADEIAGGYGRFAAGVFQPFLSEMHIQNGNIKSYKDFAEYEVKSDSTVLEFVSKDFKSLQRLLDEQIDIFHGFHGSNFMKQLKFEISQRLPESLMRQDKMSMANSIENRVPLLDNEVVDFMMQLPDEMLIRFKASSPLQLSEHPFEWVQGKYILKELCAKRFGYDFAYRKKAIMVCDERSMLASDGFRELFYDSIFPSMKQRDIVDAWRVAEWYESVRSISDREFNSMWRAIGLETWCQLFLDSSVSGQYV